MKSKTSQNLLLATIMLVITAGGATSLLWLISKNSMLLAEQLDALKEQNQQEASLLRLQRLASETESDRKKLESFFLLRESDSITFLSDIEDLAPKLGLELETEGLRQITSKDQPSWIEANFSASGSRKSIEKFVQILEVLPYVSKVTFVEMKARSSDNWYVVITIQVQLLNL